MKNIIVSKTVQDYGNRSADICLVMLSVGLAGYTTISMELAECHALVMHGRWVFLLQFATTGYYPVQWSTMLFNILLACICLYKLVAILTSH